MLTLPRVRGCRWRKEFRRLLLLRAEQYYDAPKQTLARSLSFIGLSPPQGDTGWAPLLSRKVERAGSRPSGGAPPLPAAAKTLLRSFYAPGLEQLTDSLRDEPDAAEWRSWASGAST